MKRTTIVLLVLILSALLAACGLAGGGAELEGTSWALVTINGQPPIAGRTPTLRFEDGSLGGNSSCNSFGGDYSVRGSQISFGEMFWTLMACPEGGVMEQEQAYMQALGKIEQFELQEGMLVLSGPDGTELIYTLAE
jgi:heat shock protein HslJ